MKKVNVWPAFTSYKDSQLLVLQEPWSLVTSVLLHRSSWPPIWIAISVPIGPESNYVLLNLRSVLLLAFTFFFTITLHHDGQGDLQTYNSNFKKSSQILTFLLHSLGPVSRAMPAANAFSSLTRTQFSFVEPGSPFYIYQIKFKMI
jgi:hypothetical protein